MKRATEILIAAIVIGGGLVFGAVELLGGDPHKPAPATHSSVAELKHLRADLEAEEQEGDELQRRFAECEFLVSVSPAQERAERECAEEVEANFAEGDLDPPNLRAGRFR